MASTVCFLGRTPFSTRDYNRFGAGLLKKRGFDVLFLDLGRLLNPDFLEVYKPLDPLESPEVVKFKTRKEFKLFLKERENIFVIDLIGGSIDSWFVYKYFRAFGIRYASIAANSLPFIAPDRPSLIETILKYADRVGKMKGISGLDKKIKKYAAGKYASLIYSLPHILSRAQPPSMVFAGGYKYDRMLPRPDARTKTIYVHSLDYDLYLKNGNSADTADHCVFLDQFFPYDTDLATFKDGLVKNITPDNYYAGLDRYFGWFEDKFKMPVIIAAHPRSDYRKNDERFFGRKVVGGDTARLVSGSRYVLAHSSTAINLAVIYKKPIIFLTSGQFESTTFGPFIRRVAAIFNKKPVNVDHPDEFMLTEGLLTIEEPAYREFFCDYIKSPDTPEELFWDVVADKISEGL